MSSLEAAMGGRCPGPFGIGIVPVPWLDAGTLCLDASPLPGPWLDAVPVTVTYNDDEIALAAVAYGEGSTGDVEDEMSGIAQVVARQVKARGYKSVATFLASEKSYAFAASDGNPRYAKLEKSTPAERAASPGMAAALRRARAALAGGGADPSAGAWFWDGVDLKTNVANHPKVKAGIHFSDPAHDIFKLGNRHLAEEKIEYWLDAKGKPTKERGRYQWRYESTAAHGETVFWRLNADFLEATGNAQHK